jgi:hypothetical protein
MTLAGCRFCGKLVPAYNKRPVCAFHAKREGYPEPFWLEYYGPNSGLSCCFEEDDCKIEFEPNGGFVCLDCYREKP